MLGEVWGTIGGRWYVTLFAAVFAWRAIRHLGGRRTALFTVVALAAGAAAENGSVHVGVPYTRYTFDPSLRGHELFVGDVPLFVTLSYAFSTYFAFAAARLVVAGPRCTRSRHRLAEWAVSVMLAVWPVWLLDPASRLDGLYLGHLFHYQHGGFWFGLPLLSQVGYAVVTGALLALLARLGRDEPVRRVDGLQRHPHLVALATWHAQWLHLSVLAIAAGAQTVGGAALLIYVPGAVMAAVHWQALREGTTPRDGVRTEPLPEVVLAGEAPAAAPAGAAARQRA